MNVEVIGDSLRAIIDLPMPRKNLKMPDIEIAKGPLDLKKAESSDAVVHKS